MKNSTSINRFVSLIILFVFCFNIARSDWDFKIEWQYDNGGQGLGSFTLHPNDSTLIMQEGNYIVSFNTNSGSITKTAFFNHGNLFNLTYSKDASIITSDNSNEGYLGVHNPETMEYIFKEKYPDLDFHSYNDNLKILVGSGMSSIRLYDIEQKKLIKEYTFENGFFTQKNIRVTQAYLRSDKSIVYCYFYSGGSGSGRVAVIDSTGKQLYIDNADIFVSSKLIELSNNEKLFAYFAEDPQQIKIYGFDEKKIIATAEGSTSPMHLQFSYDDKVLFSGYMSSLKLYDLEKKENIKLRSGSFSKFCNSKEYRKILYNRLGNSSLRKYSMTDNTDIILENKESIQIQNQEVKDNLNITTNFVNPGNFNLKLSDIKGNLIKELESRDYEAGQYNWSYPMLDLPCGTYFLNYTINNIPQPVLKFIKIN